LFSGFQTFLQKNQNGGGIANGAGVDFLGFSVLIPVVSNGCSNPARF
jgi:hypothetical protein